MVWTGAKNIAICRNNFRIRLLTGCDGLEHEAAHFRTRSHYGALPGDSSCELCDAEVEDPEHFVSLCPALSTCRDDLLALAKSQVRQSLPNPATYLSEFCDVILGMCGLMILTHRSFVWNSLYSQGRKSHLTIPYPLKASVLIGQLSQRGGKKEEDPHHGWRHRF